MKINGLFMMFGILLHGTILTFSTGTLHAQGAGSALEFDDTDCYVDMGDPEDGSLDFGMGQDFTVTAWIKTPDLDSDRTVAAKVWDWYSSTGGPGWAVVQREHKGRVCFLISDTSGGELTEVHTTGEDWDDGQ